MAEVRIIEYTDPGCPWAFSAEPFRRRLDWTYGDAIRWETRMVGLSPSPEHYLEAGFTPEVQATAFRDIARDHGMPIDSSVRPRMEATLPACRAVVAARLNAPERERPLLRALRLRHFAGELFDEHEVIAAAAADAGLDPAALARWVGDEATERALAADMQAARNPTPAALAQDERLAGWEGGRRYTCPSYEIERLADGRRLSAPGFQPYRAYAMALANLLPGARRRPAPGDVAEVLEWAGEPLATREVAEVMRIPDAQARERLAQTAHERPLGQDGLWSLSP
ncbi:MAG: hypothetical protein AB7V42_12435 [Thermoleophilia bacterium]